MIYSDITELSDLIIEKLTEITETATKGEELLLISKSASAVFKVSQDNVDAVEAAAQAKAHAEAAKASELEVTRIYNKFGDIDSLYDEVKTIADEFGDLESAMDSIKESEQNVINIYNEISTDQVQWATSLITLQRMYIEQHAFKNFSDLTDSIINSQISHTTGIINAQRQIIKWHSFY